MTAGPAPPEDGSAGSGHRRGLAATPSSQSSAGGSATTASETAPSAAAEASSAVVASDPSYPFSHDVVLAVKLAATGQIERLCSHLSAVGELCRRMRGENRVLHAMVERVRVASMQRQRQAAEALAAADRERRGAIAEASDLRRRLGRAEEAARTARGEAVRLHAAAAAAAAAARRAGVAVSPPSEPCFEAQPGYVGSGTPSEAWGPASDGEQRGDRGRVAPAAAAAAWSAPTAPSTAARGPARAAAATATTAGAGAGAGAGAAAAAAAVLAAAASGSGALPRGAPDTRRRLRRQHTTLPPSHALSAEHGGRDGAAGALPGRRASAFSAARRNVSPSGGAMSGHLTRGRGEQPDAAPALRDAEGGEGGTLRGASAAGGLASSSPGRRPPRSPGRQHPPRGASPPAASRNRSQSRWVSPLPVRSDLAPAEPNLSPSRSILTADVARMSLARLAASADPGRAARSPRAHPPQTGASAARQLLAAHTASLSQRRGTSGDGGRAAPAGGHAGGRGGGAERSADGSAAGPMAVSPPARGARHGPSSGREGAGRARPSLGGSGLQQGGKPSSSRVAGRAGSSGRAPGPGDRPRRALARAATGLDRPLAGRAGGLRRASLSPGRGGRGGAAAPRARQGRAAGSRTPGPPAGARSAMAAAATRRLRQPVTSNFGRAQSRGRDQQQHQQQKQQVARGPRGAAGRTPGAARGAGSRQRSGSARRGAGGADGSQQRGQPGGAVAGMRMPRPPSLASFGNPGGAL